VSGLSLPVVAGAALAPAAFGVAGLLGGEGSGDCALTLIAHNPTAASQIEKGTVRDTRIVSLIAGVSYPHH
jgi:hypothetical protein